MSRSKPWALFGTCLTLLTACAPADGAAPGTTTAPLICGQRCGECDAGTYDCSTSECVYPSAHVPPLLATGLPPAPTGARVVFDPEDFYGPSEYQKVNQALREAGKVGGAVVLGKVYEIDRALDIYGGTMLTGGGLRRKCMPAATVTVAPAIGDACVTVDSVAGYEPYQQAAATQQAGGGYNDTLGLYGVLHADPRTSQLCGTQPVSFAMPAGTRLPAVFTMMRVFGVVADGIVVDSVLFDGSNDCNDVTHDWRFNNALAIRGANTVRNSLFYDSPSETLTTCGGTVADNLGLHLQGGLDHISCGTPALDIISGNYIENANVATDAVMGHSEAVITFSANPLPLEMHDNVFRHSKEPAIGMVGAGTETLYVEGDCYAHTRGSVLMHASADGQYSRLVDVELIGAWPKVQ